MAIVTTASPGQSVVLPSSGSISPAVTRGKLRAKIYNETVAITISSIQVTATDGTNTVNVADWTPAVGVAISATAYVDVTFDYLTDTSTAGGGATGTLIFGGATSFAFAIISTGASGAASGDFEAAVEP